MTEEFIHQLHITGPETGQTFTIPPGTSTIGRQPGNSLVLSHFLVSRRHAQVDGTAASCYITDLNSSNGVVVNGERLTPGVPVRLAPSAVIQIGPFTLRYEQIPVEAEQELTPAEPVIETPEPAVDTQELLEPEILAFLGDEALEAPERGETDLLSATPPPPPPPPQAEAPVNGAYMPPPGLSLTHSRYLEYLPGIYHTDFITRLLALLESILAPIEWNVDNFDLYLDPRTAPADFLPWLANWFALTFDDSWSQAQRRTLLAEAHHIYARRGTKCALSRVLEIYLGEAPEIDDMDKNLEPFTFVVKLPRRPGVNRALLESIIDMNKPAHTSYKIVIES